MLLPSEEHLLCWWQRFFVWYYLILCCNLHKSVIDFIDVYVVCVIFLCHYCTFWFVICSFLMDMDIMEDHSNRRTGVILYHSLIRLEGFFNSFTTLIYCGNCLWRFHKILLVPLTSIRLSFSQKSHYILFPKVASCTFFVVQEKGVGWRRAWNFLW